MNESQPKASTNDTEYAKLELMLREQLRVTPDMHLSRLMLLELYFKIGRRAAFLAEARKLFKRVDNPEASLEWQRCAAMGRSLDPDEDMFHLGSNELLQAAEAAAVAETVRRARRIGEDDRHRDCFQELASAYEDALKNPSFISTLDRELVHSAGRPSSLPHLTNLSKHLGGAQIYLKREDMSPRDTHLTMMVIGQALLARELGYNSVVTSTTNGHRGLLVASIAARFNLDCVIYMHSNDRQAYLPRVFRMSLMGADVRTVSPDTHDVREVALDHWADNRRTCLMVTGLDAMPPPYPAMHRNFIAAIGRESKLQVRAAARRAPALIVARGGNYPDALGLFPPFADDNNTRLVCVEPPPRKTAADLESDQDDDGSELPELVLGPEAEHGPAPESLEGLSYPSVAREHQWLRSISNVEYLPVADDKIVPAATDLARFEGLAPSRETGRAVAWALEAAPSLDKADAVVIMFADGDNDDLIDIGEEFALSLDRAANAARGR